MNDSYERWTEAALAINERFAVFQARIDRKRAERGMAEGAEPGMAEGADD
jgi:hypothetical protein